MHPTASINTYVKGITFVHSVAVQPGETGRPEPPRFGGVGEPYSAPRIVDTPARRPWIARVGCTEFELSAFDLLTYSSEEAALVSMVAAYHTIKPKAVLLTTSAMLYKMLRLSEPPLSMPR